MRQFPVRLYAAFAAARFGGNIAGIVYDDLGLSSDEMLAIASDLGAPTTGFVSPRTGSRIGVRFFSSRGEMAMCGHVTIAVFAALFNDKRIASEGGDFVQVEFVRPDIGCRNFLEQKTHRKTA